jgi:hypothetical protein
MMRAFIRVAMGLSVISVWVSCNTAERTSSTKDVEVRTGEFLGESYVIFHDAESGQVKLRQCKDNAVAKGKKWLNRNDCTGMPAKVGKPFFRSAIEFNEFRSHASVRAGVADIKELRKQAARLNSEVNSINSDIQNIENDRKLAANDIERANLDESEAALRKTLGAKPDEIIRINQQVDIEEDKQRRVDALIASLKSGVDEGRLDAGAAATNGVSDFDVIVYPFTKQGVDLDLVKVEETKPVTPVVPVVTPTQPKPVVEKDPAVITPPATVAVDYDKVILPIITNSCASARCHNGSSKIPNFLERKTVDEFRESMIERLNEPDSGAGGMPIPKTKITPENMQTLIKFLSSKP